VHSASVCSIVSCRPIAINQYDVTAGQRCMITRLQIHNASRPITDLSPFHRQRADPLK